MNEDRIVDGLLIGGYLTIIILRICNVINWSWIWILCPFWLILGGALIGLVLGILMGIPWKIYNIIKEKKHETQH